MKPTIATLDLVLAAAKHTAAQAISLRDHDKRIFLNSIFVTQHARKGDWLLFKVEFVYENFIAGPELPKDDLRLFVPWDFVRNIIGEITGDGY